jgi:hypothetical protein
MDRIAASRTLSCLLTIGSSVAEDVSETCCKSAAALMA